MIDGGFPRDITALTLYSTVSLENPIKSHQKSFRPYSILFPFTYQVFITV